MIKIYIDFDGVILDTWSVITKEYYNKYGNLNITEERLKMIMLDIGWDNIILKSKEINDSIDNIIKISQNYNICILSKVNSEEEKEAKKRFLLNHNIKNMKFVRYEDTKAIYAISDKDILIDDTVKNLDEWSFSGGFGIFFAKNLNAFDDYGTINDKYVFVDNLCKICGIIESRMED